MLFRSLFVLVFGISAVNAEVRVASLNTVLGGLTREVGGGRVSVEDIVKPGIDPHIFEPSPGDIRRVADADLVVAGGLGLEGYLMRLEDAAGATKFLKAGDYIDPLYTDPEAAGHDHGHDHGHGHGHGEADEDGRIVDPHWWHSVRSTRAVVRALRDRLIEIDPDGRSEYEANASALLERMEKLDEWIRAEVAVIPRSARILITSHDAFGYFARDYGFKILAVQGMSTTEQPSSQKVRELIAEIRESGVRAIFAENIENPKILEEVTKETGIQPGGILYAAGLGEDTASTYEAMIRHNTSTIVEALR
jgi:zinc/manganese transport system substrate-binding protein